MATTENAQDTGHDLQRIRDWHFSLRIRHTAHAKCHSVFRKRDRLLGVLSSVLSAVVATSIFASLMESDKTAILIFAGIVGVLATVLATAYSFLKYSELAERHKQAAAGFGQLRHELDLILLDKKLSDNELSALPDFVSRWSELEGASPEIPQKIFDEAQDYVKGMPSLQV